MNTEIYPDALYKYRSFDSVITRYDHLTDNIYEDSSCKMHTNCRISVKFDGAHYVLDQLINESAKNYHYFHEKIKGDSDFLIDLDEAKLYQANFLLTYYEEALKTNTIALSDTESKISTSTNPELAKQSIKLMDFSDKIYLLGMDNKVLIHEIFQKVFNYSGLLHLITNDDFVVSDDKEELFMDVVSQDYDDDRYHPTTYKGFSTKEALDNYLTAISYDQLTKEQESLNKELKELKELIENQKSKVQERISILEYKNALKSK